MAQPAVGTMMRGFGHGKGNKIFTGSHGAHDRDRVAKSHAWIAWGRRDLGDESSAVALWSTLTNMKRAPNLCGSEPPEQRQRLGNAGIGRSSAAGLGRRPDLLTRGR